MGYEDRSHGRPTWPLATINFRDHLLAALKTLPDVREFHIHVLVTAPAKDNSLYPYASPRPRLYVQDILVLLSEQANPDAPRMLVAAIEACVYHAPATDCAILYVSKIDSTGQGSTPPPTAALVKAFIRWYADPATRPVAARHLWVQLFARAQGQYLFPNSSDYPGKCPLSDAGLCAWWRRVMGQVGGDVREAVGVEGRVDMYYVLPGSKSWEVAFHHLLPGHNGSTDIHTAKPISHFRVPLQNRDLHGWPTLRVGQQGLSTRASRTCHTPLCIVVPVAHQLGLSIGRIRLFPWAACCL